MTAASNFVWSRTAAIVFFVRGAILIRVAVSNPALKSVGRIALQRVATPVPRTMNRADGLMAALADTDARIGCAMRLLEADVGGPTAQAAMRARCHAILQDLETATQLVTALIPLSPALRDFLEDRARSIGEQRRRVQALL
jgi:hypothetical protein